MTLLVCWIVVGCCLLALAIRASLRWRYRRRGMAGSDALMARTRAEHAGFTRVSAGHVPACDCETCRDHRSGSGNC